MFANTTIRRVLAVLALASPTLPAIATEYQLQGGRSYMNSHGASTVFGEVVFDEHAIGSSYFTWSPDASIGWIDGRNLHHYRDYHPGVHDDIWLIAGGVRLHYGAKDAWYRPLFFSFQGAAHTGHTMALGSTGEFVSTLGWQGQYFNVQIRHISNGGLHSPNRGETMALVGVAFGAHH